MTAMAVKRARVASEYVSIKGFIMFNFFLVVGKKLI